MGKISRLLLLVSGVFFCTLLTACGAEDEILKYKLILDNGFEAEKTEYAAGENVTVRYDIIATDTDYHFYSDDVDFEQNYDGGYVFTFVMPEHDVTLHVESRNSMEYDPGAYLPEVNPGAAELTFETFDGGGPEFNVYVDDESIVSFETDIRYGSSGSEAVDGGSKNVVITFTGENPGETDITIEERSPIADNLDRRYRVTVDEELKVSIEQLSVRDINMEPVDLGLYINGEEVPVVWENNESVEELMFISPLKIQMSMYGGFEQVGSLEEGISHEDEQITTDPGDIVLYSGDKIVIFYGSNSWEYTRLGHVEMTKAELTELLGNGDVEITIE